MAPAGTVNLYHGHASLLDSMSLRDGFWHVLSPAEHERHNRFKFQRHRDEYLFAHGLLRFVLGARTGRAAESLCFEHSERGKPSLIPPADAPLHFNLSHSEGMVVIALTSAGDIGVDVEPADRPADSLLYRTVLTQREQQELEAVEETERPVRFMRLWTLKEALLKARGEGITAHPERICLELDQADWRRLRIRQDTVSGACRLWQFPLNDFICAIAVLTTAECTVAAASVEESLPAIMKPAPR